MSAVMTFEPHPREFFAGKKGGLRIYPFRNKAALLRETGIGVLFAARFNRALASTTAESFVEHILLGQLKARHLITGYNFAFGKGRGGSIESLAHEAKRHGFGFTALPPVMQGTDTISSSAIRHALVSGDMTGAAHMLGRTYGISGRVRHGDARGRELGFPTINLPLGELFPPKFGIYAGRVRFANGERYDAAVSIGIRPMFRAEMPLLEAHCIGMNRSCYGERAEVELVRFLRDEASFTSIDALKRQMADDCQQAKNILSTTA